jgi:hypothetical protein
MNITIKYCKIHDTITIQMEDDCHPDETTILLQTIDVTSTPAPLLQCSTALVYEPPVLATHYYAHLLPIISHTWTSLLPWLLTIYLALCSVSHQVVFFMFPCWTLLCFCIRSMFVIIKLTLPLFPDSLHLRYNGWGMSWFPSVRIEFTIPKGFSLDAWTMRTFTPLSNAQDRFDRAC